MKLHTQTRKQSIPGRFSPLMRPGYDAKSVLKISSAVAEQVRQWEVGGCHTLGPSGLEWSGC